MNTNDTKTVGLVPAERHRLMRASARLEAAADVLRPLCKLDDRIGRVAREIEKKARDAANGIREIVLLDEVGGA